MIIVTKNILPKDGKVYYSLSKSFDTGVRACVEDDGESWSERTTKLNFVNLIDKSDSYEQGLFLCLSDDAERNIREEATVQLDIDKKKSYNLLCCYRNRNTGECYYRIDLEILIDLAYSSSIKYTFDPKDDSYIIQRDKDISKFKEYAISYLSAMKNGTVKMLSDDVGQDILKEMESFEQVISEKKNEETRKNEEEKKKGFLKKFKWLLYVIGIIVLIKCCS